MEPDDSRTAGSRSSGRSRPRAKRGRTRFSRTPMTLGSAHWTAWLLFSVGAVAAPGAAGGGRGDGADPAAPAPARGGAGGAAGAGAAAHQRRRVLVTRRLPRPCARRAVGRAPSSRARVRPEACVRPGGDPPTALSARKSGSFPPAFSRGQLLASAIPEGVAPRPERPRGRPMRITDTRAAGHEGTALLCGSFCASRRGA
jgi:hypothetical protein